jgi:hypothetical protein
MLLLWEDAREEETDEKEEEEELLSEALGQKQLIIHCSFNQFERRE